MNPKTVTLIHFAPEWIVSYITQHPIQWHSAELADLHAIGDQAGRPPTPFSLAFFDLVLTKKALFTQEEHYEYCMFHWESERPGWYDSLGEDQKRGLRAKAYRNCYPSFVDQLHVWGMLAQANWFDRCTLDVFDDYVGKTDLTLWNGDEPTKLALQIGSERARKCRKHKDENRGGAIVPSVTIELSMDRPKSPGNKRWYQLSDFASLTPSLSQPIPVAVTADTVNEQLQRTFWD